MKAVMAMNKQIRGEESSLLEAALGATTYASPEVQWLAEMLSGDKDLVSSQGNSDLLFIMIAWYRRAA